MTIICKFCDSISVVKRGFARDKQRYLCKTCKKHFVEGDRRVVYSEEQKLRVIKYYLNGTGFRGIERVEGISHSLIIYWVKKIAQKIKCKLDNTPISEDMKTIEILEVDELFTYCKKKGIKAMFGLQLTETETK